MNWKVILGAMALVLFLGVCFYLGERIADEPDVEEGGESTTIHTDTANPKKDPAHITRDKKTTVTKTKHARVALQKPTVNLATNSVTDTAEQKKLDALQLALDEENLNNVRAASAELARSSSPYIRGKVVEAFRWFKQPAVVDLRGMMNDTDSEVATDAKDGWLEAVADITDAEIKAQELYEGMKTMQDVDALRESIMEYYDIDDGIALAHIMQLIQSGNPNAALVGREGYEHIAGDPYTTPEAGQSWIDTWRRENPLEGSAPVN